MNTAYAIACSSTVTNEWPNSRYTDHNNGTVTDNTTGLMWKQCSQGQEADSNTCKDEDEATSHTWKAALELASTESFAGYSDWRLPNFKELFSLAALNCHQPSINETLFPNTAFVKISGTIPLDNDSREYWSSTSVAGNSKGVKVIRFTLGTSQKPNIERENVYKVRLVRGGQ